MNINKHFLSYLVQIFLEWETFQINFDVLLAVHLSIFISVFNQLDAQNLFHASTCFEQMCSSSGGQNCITEPLVSSHL